MKTATLVTIAVLLASGCGRDDAARSRISALEARQNTAEEAAKKAGATNAAALFDLQFKMLNKLDEEKAAVVDPASRDYSIAHNEYGAFPIIVDDVQPYLDGHKLRLRVGNLTAATITGVSLEITYGLRPGGLPANYQQLSPVDKWNTLQDRVAKSEEDAKNRKTVSVNAGKELLPGSWNTVDVIIAPSKPSEVGHLEVTVKSTGLQLSSH